MDDPVCPSEATARRFFVKGFRTWTRLHDAVSDEPLLLADCLEKLDTAFPGHPAFQRQLLLEYSLRTLFANGISTWDTRVDDVRPTCSMPSFQLPFRIPISADTSTAITPSKVPRQGSPPLFGSEDNHLMILVLAWGYILSARWADLIPGTTLLQYSQSQAVCAETSEMSTAEPRGSVSVDLGSVGIEAARWWASVLAPEEGWQAIIEAPDGRKLHSPWSIRLPKPPIFNLSARDLRPSSIPPSAPAASFSMAMSYLSDYCALHGVGNQSRAALAAALLLPLANSERRRVLLPVPRILEKSGTDRINRGEMNGNRPTFPTTPQLDKLLTLSCNTKGLTALLFSTFFDPAVPCNLVSPWLQGTFSAIDAMAVDRETLTRILVKRNPDIGFLWIGAVITDLHKEFLQRARYGSTDIELHSAAWTQTLQTFIQLPVSRGPSQDNAMAMRRSDECRLLYLASEEYRAHVPQSPWEPFGDSGIEGTEIEVRLHLPCCGHGLRYKAWSWAFQEEQQHVQTSPEKAPAASLISARSSSRSRNTELDGSTVPFKDFDYGDDKASGHATLMLFMWLCRNGFPSTEHKIRRHEWVCETMNLEDKEAYESWSDSDDGIGVRKRKAKSAAASPKLARWIAGVDRNCH